MIIRKKWLFNLLSISVRSSCIMKWSPLEVINNSQISSIGNKRENTLILGTSSCIMYGSPWKERNEKNEQAYDLPSQFVPSINLTAFINHHINTFNVTEREMEYIKLFIIITYPPQAAA